VAIRLGQQSWAGGSLFQDMVSTLSHVVSLDKILYSTLSLSTQGYKCVQVNYQGILWKCLELTLWWTSIPFRGGVEILLVTLYWVSYDGPAPIQEGVAILLVTLCWGYRLASHPRWSSNTSSHFMLGILWWPSTHPGGSSNTPSHFMLGILRQTSIPSTLE